MKPPPLLLGAALLFWGWQSDFLAVGAAMALAVEGARLLKMRWEFSDDDFSRMWTLCTLLFLLASIYAFSISEGPSSFSSLFLNPTPAAQRVAGTSSARAAASLFRWLPMIIFPFILVQAVSAREQIPLHTVSRILRRRWRNALRAGMPAAAGPRSMNVGYPYFAVCLFSSSVHAADNASFFWGISGLLAWAPSRSSQPSGLATLRNAVSRRCRATSRNWTRNGSRCWRGADSTLRATRRPSAALAN
jgi:hypothetical protein